MVVGFGVNNFSMQRGSFKYKHNIKWKSNCKLINKEENDNGFTLTFKGLKHNTVHILYILIEDDKTNIKHERIDNLGIKLNHYWLIFDSDKNEHFYGLW